LTKRRVEVGYNAEDLLAKAVERDRKAQVDKAADRNIPSRMRAVLKLKDDSCQPSRSSGRRRH